MTPTQQLAEYLIEQPIGDWINDLRDAGVSYRMIARRLMEATGGQVDVSDETIRGWQSDHRASA